MRARLLGNRIFQAASLSIAAHILGQAIRLGGNLIMTRLLMPEAFGLMSIVMAVQVTITLLSDIGIRVSVIQNHREDPEFLNTAWTIQFLRGLGIWGTCLVLALGLAAAGQAGYLSPGSAWAAPSLPMVLAATSFVTVIYGLQSTNYLTASRNLAVKRLLIIDIVGQIAGLAVMIALGILTRSIWSLVSAGIVAAIITTIMSHVYLPGIANRFGWDAQARHEIYKFGIWILASSVTSVLAGNIDRILLGGLVSATTMGLYSIALSLTLIVDGAGSRLYELVMLPALSQVAREDRGRFRQALQRLRLPFDLGYLAAAGFIVAIGPHLIELLYDPRYEGAGAILQILSFSLVFARYGIFPIAYLALGHPHTLAILNSVKLAAAVVLILVLYSYFGFTGALYGVAFHSAAVLPIYLWFNRRYGLNDFIFELLVLPAWPAGYIAGLALLEVASLLHI